MIKKAVILAAGRGQRFDPITRVIPKPMLPVGNKPALDYIIQELWDSGIEQILIVVGHRKEIILDYYEGVPGIQFVEQQTLGGTAPAVLLAEDFVNQEAFALCLADEIMESSTPCSRQLIELFVAKHATMVTVIEETTAEKIRAYNSVTIAETDGNIHRLSAIVEKPQESNPALFTSVGRYVIAPTIFEEIRSVQSNGEQEIYLTEAFNSLMRNHAVFGLIFEGTRWDIGTKEGWIATNVKLGLDA